MNKMFKLGLMMLVLLSSMLKVLGQQGIPLSQDMLMAMKMNQPITEYENDLAGIAFDSLVAELDTDAKRQAFWLNIYVVYSQKLLTDSEGGVCNKRCKKKKVISVAERVYSLTDILYLILLHSKCPVIGKQKLYVHKWEKVLRVGYPDGRILLAIDSDADIANKFTYFVPNDIDYQLNELSMIFIRKFVYYNVDKNEVFIPKWLKNFKREFGYKSGIYVGLRKAGLIPPGAEPKIVYSDKITTLK